MTTADLASQHLIPTSAAEAGIVNRRDSARAVSRLAPPGTAMTSMFSRGAVRLADNMAIATFCIDLTAVEAK